MLKLLATVALLSATPAMAFEQYHPQPGDDDADAKLCEGVPDFQKCMDEMFNTRLHRIMSDRIIMEVTAEIGRRLDRIEKRLDEIERRQQPSSVAKGR